MDHLSHTIMAVIYPSIPVDGIFIDFGHRNPLDAFVLVDLFNDPDAQSISC